MNLKEYLITLKDFSQTEPFIDKGTRGDNPVKFGANNLYPQEVLYLINNSPIQKAIIKNRVACMWGMGFDTYTENIYTPNLTETWDTFAFKCIVDMVYFGAFYVQIIPNEYGNQYSFYHQPFDQVRLGNYNADNKIETGYICTDWAKSNLNTNVAKIKMWGTETPKKGEKYLMQFKPYDPDKLFYPVPDFMSSANYIMADIALSKFYCNYVKNGFSGITIIRYPTEIEEDRQKLLYENIKQNFSGVENTGVVMVLFGENGILPEVGSLTPQDADFYDNYSERVLKFLVSGNRLTSPLLAGLQTKSGFSSKSDEMLSAHEYYMTNVIHLDRSFVLDKINFLLQLNGYSRCLNIVDFDMAAILKGEQKKIEEIEDKEEDILDIEDSGTEAEQVEKEKEEQEIIDENTK